MDGLTTGKVARDRRPRSAGMVDKVKAGDKIKFTAENTGGAFMLTKIETVK